jgi:integration host factor subunit alpha
MTKSELIKAIQSSVCVSTETAKEVIDEAINQITIALANNDEVNLRGLGSFSVSDKAERMGRNPKTGEDAVITARKVVTFKCSTVLKNYLNQK